MKRLLLVVGLPKSGTKTIHRAMIEAGLTSAHYKWRGRFCGSLMYIARAHGRSPLASLPECVTQADACSEVDRVNLWPQMDRAMLRDVREHHPDVLLLLNTRDPDSLVESISRWKDYRERLMRANIPGLPPGVGGKDSELRRWIEEHYARVREWCARDPRFLEFSVSDLLAKEKLGAALGVTLPWWGVENRNGAPT